MVNDLANNKFVKKYNKSTDSPREILNLIKITLLTMPLGSLLKGLFSKMSLPFRNQINHCKAKGHKENIQ